jgi:hypothetical protein
MAGITASVSTVDEIMPPTIGAAMRLMTSEPVPVPHMIGSRPAMMATTVIIFGPHPFDGAFHDGLVEIVQRWVADFRRGAWPSILPRHDRGRSA